MVFLLLRDANEMKCNSEGEKFYPLFYRIFKVCHCKTVKYINTRAGRHDGVFGYFSRGEVEKKIANSRLVNKPARASSRDPDLDPVRDTTDATRRLAGRLAFNSGALFCDSCPKADAHATRRRFLPFLDSGHARTNKQVMFLDALAYGIYYFFLFEFWKKRGVLLFSVEPACIIVLFFFFPGRTAALLSGSENLYFIRDVYFIWMKIKTAKSSFVL